MRIVPCRFNRRHCVPTWAGGFQPRRPRVRQTGGHAPRIGFPGGRQRPGGKSGIRKVKTPAAAEAPGRVSGAAVGYQGIRGGGRWNPVRNIKGPFVDRASAGAARRVPEPAWNENGKPPGGPGGGSWESRARGGRRSACRSTLAAFDGRPLPGGPRNGPRRGWRRRANPTEGRPAKPQPGAPRGALYREAFSSIHCCTSSSNHRWTPGDISKGAGKLPDSIQRYSVDRETPRSWRTLHLSTSLHIVFLLCELIVKRVRRAVRFNTRGAADG